MDIEEWTYYLQGSFCLFQALGKLESAEEGIILYIEGL